MHGFGPAASTGARTRGAERFPGRGELVMGRSPLSQFRIGLAVGVMLLAGGCVSLPTFSPAKDLPAIAPVASAHAKWESKVRFLEDIVHGGRPTPRITADLYLFAANHAAAPADRTVP